MIIKLPPWWQTRWQTDPFWHVFHLAGEIYREQPGRKTLRFIDNGEVYFAKMHFGVGWKEIIKNLLHGRLPVLGAKNEWQAIQQLQTFGFTPTVVGYGWRGKNPAQQQSFIISKELSCTVSLEDFCRDWPKEPPPPKIKWALIRKVAEIARNIHQQGVNHRDFYLCHFLLEIAGGRELLEPGQLTLYVIDWHRAQVRRRVPLRWRIKDLAGLYFSAMDIGLTQRDLLRFIHAYTETKIHWRFWRRVEKRAIKLYRKIWCHLPRNLRMPCYLPLQNGGYLQLQQSIRSQPKKRLVAVGEWQGKKVLIKLFTRKKYARAEIRGSQNLQRHQFATPALLHHGWSQHRALYTVCYQYLENAVSLADIYRETTDTTKKQLLQRLFDLLQQQHAAGLQQHDLHLDNFLLQDDHIWTVDTASIHQHAHTYDLEKHLALLIAQLPRIEKDYWLKQMPALHKHVLRWEKQQLNKHLQKVLRNCSGYYGESTDQYFIICRRSYYTTSMQKLIQSLLHQAIAANEITIDGHLLKIKFLKPKRFIDYFISAGEKLWLELQCQHFLEKSSVEPIAFIEKRFLGWIKFAYIISRDEI